jgi:phosphatidylserine decarboxylase
MNVFDVHVNRSPFAGMIGHQIYVKGKFVNASLDKAHHENERMVQRLDTGDKRAPHIGIVQIAGLVARRILCDVHVDDKLNAGQLFGIIRFGSRVDVWVPEKVAPLVLVGQKTIAGETVLADLSGKRSEP